MTLPQNQSPAEFEYYVNATSIEEACRALGDGVGTILAGGSDLWVQKDEGVKIFGPRLINISRVDELAEISIGNDHVRLGARVTMTDILNHGELGNIAPGLLEAANRFASPQIRNVATVGGNFANASPAADSVIPLICLDAEIELARLDGNAVAIRSIPSADFFTGPGKTVRTDDELITAISFKPRDGKSLARFFKSGPRPALEISIVSLGIAADILDGKLSNVRIALGAVAPIPFRARKTEALIEGQKIDDKLIHAALECLVSEISPIGDVRGSKWYRQHLARTYLQEALTDVA